MGPAVAFGVDFSKIWYISQGSPEIQNQSESCLTEAPQVYVGTSKHEVGGTGWWAAM